MSGVEIQELLECSDTSRKPGSGAADETLPEGAELVTPVLLLLLVSGILVVVAAEEEGMMEGVAADDRGRRLTTDCEASSAV